MAKTKTGLEPPTSDLTADIPTIRASHLLFHIMHQSTYITNKLVVPFYKPNRHACKSLYIYYYPLLTTVHACICIYMYCYSYLHHLLLQLLQSNYCGCWDIRWPSTGLSRQCFTRVNFMFYSFSLL